MKILLLGANGQLGKQLCRTLPSQGKLTACDKSECDLRNQASILAAIDRHCPDVIVNAAAYTAVDKAETDREMAYLINVDAPGLLATEAAACGIFLIHYSTDYVFDGTKVEPYRETDQPNPINVYGASKLAGEEVIASSKCDHLIFRTSWVIGQDNQNFAKTILRLARERESLSVINDQYGVPTSPALIAKVTASAMDALSEATSWPIGTYHLTPKGSTTWFGVAQALLKLAEDRGISVLAKESTLQAIKTSEYPTAALRPENSRLNTAKLERQLEFELPDWENEFLKVADKIIREIGSA